MNPIVSAGKQISYFKIVTPAATGIIDTINKTIMVSVPAGTNLASLTTDISIAAGYTISPVSGLAQNFTNPVVYTITRPGNTTITWTVTVTTPVSAGKQISYFKIVTPAATGKIDTTAKTILIIVPTGTSLTSLTTDISIAAGYTINPASGLAQNFTNPVIYTVTRSGTTATTWTVTVTNPVSAGNQINYFKIVTPAATGIIDTTAKTIVVSVPVGTDLTSLTTDISLATGHTISPASGVAKDFTNPVVYTVTSPTNTETIWTVTVKIAYPLVSAGKQITYFKIVTPEATGVIDTVNKTITVTVPAGTVLTNLTTDISIAAGHTISPASGVAKDFTNPVAYTITSPNNITTTWTVTVKTPVITISQNITQSVTWTSDNIYLITGDRSVSNDAILTIQPGTIIKFDAGASLSFGYSSGATLIANGTESNPIVFTSSASSPAAGAWENLFFYGNTSTNTSLAYCNIQYAGSNTNNGALCINGCDIAVNNCSISNSGSSGIWTNYTNSKGGFVTFTNNTINTTTKYGITIHSQKLSTLGTGNTFTNIKGIYVGGDYNSNTAQTWRNLNVPYIVDQRISIDGNLTIEPGTVFKFEVGGYLRIGYYASTTFVADGTSSAPITFTSNATSPAAGSWKYILFNGYTQSNSIMDNCIIEYAGSDAAMASLTIYSASIVFTNNIIRNSGSYGIGLNTDAGFQSFTDNTINTCVNHLISIGTKHLPELGSGNTLTAAAGKGIWIWGDAQYADAVTWRNLNVPYILDQRISIDGNITIEPGTIFKSEANGYLRIGYYASTTFIADGTSSAPITFTSNSSSPAAGAWKYISFHGYTQTNSIMDNCIIEYAGSDVALSSLNLYGASIAFTNNTIRNSGSYGIGLDTNAGFQSFTDNTINTCADHLISISTAHLPELGSGNTLTAAAGKGIWIWGDAQYADAVTWRNLNVPYILDQRISIDGNITIEPGTTFKSEANGYLRIGYYASTTFIADGTSSDPITFTSNSSSPAAGAWKYISFHGYTQTNSIMDNCIIEYAGSDVTLSSLNLYGASIAFTNNILRNSGSYGIGLDTNAGFQSFANNTINTCADHLISISTAHLPELGTGNILTAATGKGILIWGDVKYENAVTWKKQTADFYVTGGRCRIDGDITMEAGSKFLFINDAYFYFGYYAITKITAVGTSTGKITFTSAASSPVAGGWKGLYFGSNTQSNTALTYCEFMYTGMSGIPAIYTRISFPVNNTTIDNFSTTNAAEYLTGITVPPGSGNNFTWVAN